MELSRRAEPGLVPVSYVLVIVYQHGVSRVGCSHTQLGSWRGVMPAQVVAPA